MRHISERQVTVITANKTLAHFTRHWELVDRVCFTLPSDGEFRGLVDATYLTLRTVYYPY